MIHKYIEKESKPLHLVSLILAIIFIVTLKVVECLLESIALLIVVCTPFQGNFVFAGMPWLCALILWSC